MVDSSYKLIPASFTAIPSQQRENSANIIVATEISADLDVVGFVVGPDGDLPESLNMDRAALGRAGFEAEAGQTLVLPQPTGPAFIVVGAGPVAKHTPAALRDVAAAFARAAARFSQLGITLGDTFVLPAEDLGQLVVEGVLLARYRYVELQPTTKHIPLVSLDLVVAPEQVDAVTAGVRTGEILARAANLARDLANTPPGHLTATNLGDIALQLGDEYGLGVEVFDKELIIAMGCGGLLGVNAGSVEEPRIIKLTYTPSVSPETASAPHLFLVGKGIMYDSGGISLKPSDPMHLAMKMDMAGAAAVLGAMTALKQLGCTTAVSAYLMCTDNMPSGLAMKLGDVLTIRGGTTVEVKNTDAEGRLVMSDALVLATEETPDAIVDIATLTGAAMMAFGTHTAAVLGNNQVLIEQAKTASANTDESIWQLPLEHRYRPQLKSDIADISNMGGKYAGATLAALFLNDFVADIPWAHLDIAGTMQADADDSWRTQGATGFGTRLLVDLALNFTPEKLAKAN